MNAFRKVFQGKHVFLPVIHVSDVDLSLHNARIALENGGDGIFLINHEVNWEFLYKTYKFIREELPNLWIGMNPLSLYNSEVFEQIPRTLQGLWLDDAGLREGRANPTERAEQLHKARGDWQGIYFGGVAFKYQAPVMDLESVARLAMPFVDVITTSGDGTGIQPVVGKIQKIRKAVGEFPIAIASGITPENVQEYMPYADCFLVATGISFDASRLDPKRVRDFARALGK